MSSKSRFKWNRAVPAAGTSSQPGYFRFNLKRMKQIPVSLGIAAAGGGSTPIITAHVPASSWGLTKNLLIRGFYQFTIPPGPLPPNYNVIESIDQLQSGAIPLLTPPPFVPIAGTFSTWIQRNIVRVDPIQYAVDLGDAMKFNFANFDDSLRHVISIAPLVAPFDYSIPIVVALEFNLPGTIPGARIQALWAEAFLEQATNLGKLP